MMGSGVRLLSIGLVSVLAVTAAWGVDLTFEERVQAEMALELVRQSHRGTAVEPSTSIVRGSHTHDVGSCRAEKERRVTGRALPRSRVITESVPSQPIQFSWY